MRKNKENYNKFKRCWKLILTSRFDLNCSICMKYVCFKNLTTEVAIFYYLLNLDVELKETYYLYQNLLYAIQTKDFELFEQIINSNKISDYMKTTIKTLKEFLPFIKNTLEANYNNSIMKKIIILVNLLRELALDLEILEILKGL